MALQDKESEHFGTLTRIALTPEPAIPAVSCYRQTFAITVLDQSAIKQPVELENVTVETVPIAVSYEAPPPENNMFNLD